MEVRQDKALKMSLHQPVLLTGNRSRGTSTQMLNFTKITNNLVK